MHMAKLLLHALSTLCGAAIVGFTPAPPARAQAPSEQLSDGSELVAACRSANENPASEGSRLCNGYLLGYLQANPTVAFSEELPSAYMQRVLRTRAPDHPQTKTVKTAKFCLEGENSVAEIRDHVAGFDPKVAANIAPASLVERVLEQHYHCRR